MNALRSSLSLCSGVLAFTIALTDSNCCFATELISLVCGAPTPDGTATAVVPVTVKLLSGPADYVGLTYSAVDYFGHQEMCTPASARHLVSRTVSATDNVLLSCPSNSSYFPVTFTAYAAGEAAAGDQETCHTECASGNCGFLDGQTRRTATPIT